MGNVRNILQNKPDITFVISPQHTVYDALELMCEKNVGALLVTENEKLAGLFSERDYARKVILQGKSSKDTLVGEIMVADPVTITTSTTIEDCMKLMTHKFIRHLPVVENEKLIGLVSIGDVVKFIIEEQKFIIENLEHYITGQPE